MVKHLINKLGRGIKRGICIATAGLFLQGCPFPEPPQEYPTANPTAIATAYPTAEPTAEPTPLPEKHIMGRLESNEEDGVLKSGEVRAYLDTNNDGVEDSILYDYDGENFDFTVPYNSDVNIKGKLDGEDYIRTVSFNDVIEDKDITLRAVPNPTFCTPEEFKQHMSETNADFSKWDLENGFDKIKIFKNNGGDNFTNDQMTLIADKFKDANDIEKFVEGKELDSYIEIVDGSPTEFWEDKCIYVVPNNSIPGDNAGMIHTMIYSNRIIYKARIELDPIIDLSGEPLDLGSTSTVSHEAGHAFTSPGHSRLPDGVTIMNQYNYTGGAIPLVADEKAAKVVNENTYNAYERWDNILGLEW